MYMNLSQSKNKRNCCKLLVKYSNLKVIFISFNIQKCYVLYACLFISFITTNMTSKCLPNVKKYLTTKYYTNSFLTKH